jgi:hypothetical protein
MVKIEITGDTPLETLASLTAFGMHCLQNKDVYAAANRILEAEQHETRKAASGLTTSPVPAPASDPTPGPAVTPGPAAPKSGPKAPPAEVPTPPAVSVDDAPAPTVAEVRKRGIEASRKYGKEAIVANLQKFNVSGMSAIEEKDRAAFLAELDKLDVEKAGEANA